MARSPADMAATLIKLYEENGEKGKRFRLSVDAFKRVAGKARLRDAFLREVDTELRDDGYLLIDLREEQGVVAVLRQSVVMRFDDLSRDIGSYAVWLEPEDLDLEY